MENTTATTTEVVAPVLLLPIIPGSTQVVASGVLDVVKLVVPPLGEAVELDQSPYAAVVDADGVLEPTVDLALRHMFGKSRSTRFSYAKAMLRLCRFLWAIGTTPKDMTDADYRAFRRWLAHCNQLPPTMKPPHPRARHKAKDVTGYLSDATVNQNESAIRTLYRALKDNAIINASPVPQAAGTMLMQGRNPLDAPVRLAQPGAGPQGTVGPIAKRTRRQPKPLPSELVDHVLATECLRDRAMWMLMVQSGPRINEVLTMTPENMHLGEYRVDVLGKGLHGETRPVPITPQAVQAFTEYRDAMAGLGVHFEDGTSVWRSLRAPYAPLGYQAAWKRLRERIAKSTSQRFSPHCLRHTAATTMLFDLGLPIERVQEILGHAFISSTQVYLHSTTPRMVKDFLNAWETDRERPALDITAHYDQALLDNLLGVLDD